MRRMDRKADVQAERSNRSRIFYSETARELQIAERKVECAFRDLTKIDKHRSAKFFPDWAAQFKRTLHEAEAAERTTARTQRPEVTTDIAADAVFSAGIKPFEQWQVFAR